MEGWRLLVFILYDQVRVINCQAGLRGYKRKCRPSINNKLWFLLPAVYTAESEKVKLKKNKTTTECLLHASNSIQSVRWSAVRTNRRQGKEASPPRWNGANIKDIVQHACVCPEVSIREGQGVRGQTCLENWNHCHLLCQGPAWHLDSQQLKARALSVTLKPTYSQRLWHRPDNYKKCKKRTRGKNTDRDMD